MIKMGKLGVLMLLCMVALAGCNTVAGAGKDIPIRYRLSDAAQMTFTLQRRSSPFSYTPQPALGSFRRVSQRLQGCAKTDAGRCAP